MTSSTKKCYLDANILIYFKDISSPYHLESVSLIKKLVKEKFEILISPLCVDEFLHTVALYLRKIRSKKFEEELKDYLNSILSIPNLSLVNPSKNKDLQTKVVDFMVSFSIRPRDAYHLFIMKGNKIKFMATFDNDFKTVFQKGLIKKFK